MTLPPTVFFNVGWMQKYAGLHGDSLTGGGEWPEEWGLAGEIHNFAPSRGRYHGYVQTPHRGEIRLERLGGEPGCDHVDGVTVAWVARNPRAGLCLVGWYADARVHRHYTPTPRAPGWSASRRRQHKEYIATARVADSVILGEHDRTFPIPRNRPGAMGQSNVWYAESDVGRSTVKKLHRFIQAHAEGRHVRRRSGRAVEPALRVEIERAAVAAVQRYYLDLGFEVHSVERENRGWDLEARRGATTLRVEVKGTAGPAVCAELTPNELAHLGKPAGTSVLCIVTSALDARQRDVRVFQPRGAARRAVHWLDQDDRVLAIQELTGARVRCP